MVSALRRLIPSVIAGLVVGMITVVLAISFAILLFGHGLQAFMPLGIGMTLFSATLVALFVSLGSSYAGTIAIPQDRIAPILALISAAVIAKMPAGGDPATAFYTVIAAICIASLLTGLCLLALGAFRLGALIRYVPYPVIGGFLAGTGWLLVVGSFGVMTGTKPSLAALPDLLAWDALVRWLPGVGLAVIMLVATRRIKHFMLMPVLLIGAVGAFYGIVYALQVPVDAVLAEGWLLGPFPESGAWRPLTLAAVANAEWRAVFSHGSTFATIVFVSAVSVLLNGTALELAAQRDMDLNHELRVTGVANVVLGAGGGMVGFHTLSLSALALNMGSRSRITGVVQAAVCLVVLVFGTAALEYFPKPVLGGLLCFSGLTFLMAWCVDGWQRLERGDWVVVMLILITVGLFGYLQGVGVGIVACVVLFVINYSQVNVVHQVVSGAALRSHVDRSADQAGLLAVSGQRIHIMRLSGFLFFATANRLLMDVRARLANTELEPLRVMILDFERVSGMDSSVVLSFVKMRQLADQRDFFLLFTHIPEALLVQLAREGLMDEGDDVFDVHPDIDHALEWAEDRLIVEAGLHEESDHDVLRRRLHDVLGESCDLDALLAVFECREVAAGTALIRQGDPPGSLYFLAEGQVVIQLEREDAPPIRLRTLNAGGVVGELGFYLGQPRTASVVTTVPSVFYRLTRERLDTLAGEHADLVSALHRFVAHILAERVVQANAMLRSVIH